MSRRKRLSRIKKHKEKLIPKVAPKGYSYMSNGFLISDNDIEAYNNPNYLPSEFERTTYASNNLSINNFPALINNTTDNGVQFKIIDGIDINLGYLDINGETRRFRIFGDDGAQFSLQVKDVVSGGKFYDFQTNSWTTTDSTLKNQVIKGNYYEGSIKFDKPSKLHDYEIRIIAIPSGCNPTKHTPLIPVYLIDNSIDLNASTGSDSALLVKKIYSQVGSQSIITLSCISPSLGDSGEVNVDMTPDPGSTTGADTINLSTGGSLKKYSFSITLTAGSGKAFAIKRTPTIDDLCAVRTVTFGSAALPIEGEDTSSSTYYRWPVTNAGGGVTGLGDGMTLDPSSTTGGNVTAGSFIGNYNSFNTVKTVVENGCEQTIIETEVEIAKTPGIEPTGEPTLTRGVATAQAGNITFSKQQADALKSDTNVRIIGYGREHIKGMTFGTDVKLSNMKLELTEISTTISDASATGSASLSDFDVAAVTGIMDDVSELDAVNVTRTATKPIVTTISSSNITVTPGGHLLQNGQTVKFLGASNIVTITGDIEVVNMGIQNATLYFDVERFLLSK